MQTRKFYQFGQFRLEPAEHLLTRDSHPVALTPKTFELLTYLVTNRGRLISKEQLMQAVWPDSFVEDANLTVSISALRKALGERRGEPQFIDTVPKKGYRFTADVTEGVLPEDRFRDLRTELFVDPSSTPHAPGAATQVAPDLAMPTTADTPTAGGEERTLPSSQRRWAWMAMAILCVAMLFAGWKLWHGAARHPTTAVVARKVAVLPFQNLNHDPANDFLGFSLADSIINKLGYVSELTIRPSYAVQKYRSEVPDLEEVAKALSVDTLLTGSFIREGEMLRVSYQLIDVKADRILRQGTMDVKYQNLMAVQDDVAGQVVSGLALTLSTNEAERLRDQQPVSPLAYEFYLRGVDLYAQNDFPMAIKMLEKSAELYPDYALTWAHLGRSYTATASFKFGGAEQYRKAETAYQKALALDAGNLQARIFMANFLTDTGKAEASVPLLREALKANPNLAEAHWELGYAYRFGGMLDESIQESEKARELDPGVKLTSSVMNAYLYRGDYDTFSRSLPALNDSALVEFYRGFVAYHKHEREAAITALDHAFELDQDLLQAQVGRALSLGLQRQNGKAIAILQSAERKITQRGVGDAEAIYKLAQAYAELGDNDAALRAFRYSVDKGFFAYPYFQRDPLLESIRSLPGFQSVMASAQQRHAAFQQKFF